MGREYCQKCDAWLPKVADLTDEFYVVERGEIKRSGPYCSECREELIEDGAEPAEGRPDEDEEE